MICLIRTYIAHATKTGVSSDGAAADCHVHWLVIIVMHCMCLPPPTVGLIHLGRAAAI